MTTLQERQQFVSKMKANLALNNYGFKVVNNRYTPYDKAITFDNVENLPAIKELIIRLNVYQATGRKDEGKINFPEANRRIEYLFSDKNINNCVIKLKALN